jgi:hypothetical protein
MSTKRRSWSIAWVIALSLAASTTVAVAGDEQAGYLKIEPSLVAVWAFPQSGPPVSGSGFVVASDARQSYILTSSHVVRNALNVAVDIENGRGKGVPATVVDRTEGPVLTFPDLALLKIERGHLEPVRFYPAMPAMARGKGVAAAGFFKTDDIIGYQPHLSQGGISAVGAQGQLLEVNFALPEGLSGGPLFDPPSGAVIGMMQSRKAAAEIGYAISAPLVLAQYLTRHGITVQTNAVSDGNPQLLARAASGPTAEPARPVPVKIKYFRYLISLAPCGSRYAGELQPSAGGQLIRVQRDDEGRLVRFATLRDGKVLTETVNHYSPGSKNADFSEVYNGDQLVGKSQVSRRDTHNCPERVDFSTPAGALVSYSLYKYDTTTVEGSDFNAAGQLRSRRNRSFGNDKILVSERYLPPDEASAYETTFDHETGLPTLKQKLLRGKVATTSKFLYDADADMIREDLFTDTGRWWGLSEFSQRMLKRKFYQFTNETREIRISYNTRRWPVQADFFVNGALVCIFKPDQTPTGRITRTIAIDRNGQLLAEYPDAWIFQVERDGRAIDGFQSTIYRPGNWW